MELLKLIGTVWLFLLVIWAIFIILGVFIENNVDEKHPIKKWWRKHILAPDPDDNDWKNFAG